MRNKKISGLIILMTACLTTLTGCDGKSADEITATPDTVYQTAEALLTESAQDSATNTLEPTAPVLTTYTPTTTITGVVTYTSQPVTRYDASVTTQCDEAGFVSDVTIADGTEMEPGDEFTKTWELSNDGTCTWTEYYKLVFYSGDQMSGDDSLYFTDEDIAPGETVEVSVDLVAPDDEDTYVGYWILENSSGATFGLGTSGLPFYVEIVVDEDDSTSTPTPTATDEDDTEATATCTTEPTETCTFTPETEETDTPTPSDTPTFTPEAEETTETEDSGSE